MFNFGYWLLVWLLLSCPVVCDSLWPQGLQDSRPACPSPSPQVCPSSRSLHQWCRPASSSSDALFSFCSLSFPMSGIFPVSCLFTSDDKNTGLQHQSFQWKGLISLKIYWFDLLAVQETLRNLLQHHSLKASILWHSAFFMIQFSQTYVTTGKSIALTIWNFFSKVMYLLFNTPSRFVITFLPSSHPLISWLQSPSTVILESKRISVTASTFSPSICRAVMGLDAMILAFVFVF